MTSSQNSEDYGSIYKCIVPILSVVYVIRFDGNIMEQHTRAAYGGTEKIGLLGLWEQTVRACYLVPKSGS